MIVLDEVAWTYNEFKIKSWKPKKDLVRCEYNSKVLIFKLLSALSQDLRTFTGD